MRDLVAVASAALLAGGCAQGGGSETAGSRITIPDLTGLSRTYAIDLIDGLDLEIAVDRVGPRGIGRVARSTGAVPAGRLARDVVLHQDPLPGTVVDSGSTITLVVPAPRELERGEESFRLLTHCGLSFPLEYEGRFWLPTDPKLRRTINPPEGFASDGFFDEGTIRQIDGDSLVYTSSTGREVEYTPTRRSPGGCD